MLRTQGKGRAYLLVAACSSLYFVPFLRALSHNGDEGTLITGAMRVVGGEVPFRDFFEVMGPGTFYWLALFFKVFGVTWIATRLCLLVTTAGIVLLLYHLSTRLLKTSAVAPVLLFVAASYHSWNAVSHHMDSNLFALGSFAALLHWRDTGRGAALALAGAAVGMTAWFMLPKGVLLCGAYVVLLAMDNRRRLTSYLILLASFSAVIGAGVLYFWRVGGLEQLVYANLLWPLAQYSGVNAVPYGMEFRQLYWSAFLGATSRVAPAAVAMILSGFLSLPFLAAMALPAVLVAIVFIRRRAAWNRVTLPYWLAGAALWASEMHRKDIAHIVFGSPVWIVLAFYLCAQIRNPWAGRMAQVVTIAAAVLALLNPLVAATAAHKLATRRGGVYNAFPGNPVIEFMNSRIAPGEPVFIYPYAPMYYFLGGGRNATRYSILMYGINTPEQFADTVESLERRRVRYVIWDRSFPRWIHDWFPAYSIPPEDRQVVEPYLLRNYSVIGGDPAGYQFLERKP